MTLFRRSVAEGLGTALLLATVVGSGIMGERLSGGNVAIALLANSIATGGGLVALIVTFGPISGAQFNPAVTLALAATGQFPWREVLSYATAQIIGAVLGVWAAHLMFGEPVFQFSQKARPGLALNWSEVVATFGLLTVILGGLRHHSAAIPYTVAAYIVAAYWFTGSTSFANPAVTVARSLSDTFAGIDPFDAPAFIVAQFVGAAAAVAFDGWLHRGPAGTTSTG
ncbi:MAG: MIP/aquaporin family protein [Panacagrimonas sp.]